MEAMEKKTDRTLEQGDQRGSIRVPVACPTLYRIVHMEGPKRGDKKREFFYQIPSLPLLDSAENLYRHAEQTDPEVVDMLLWLDWKTSFMMKTLSKKDDEDIFPHHATILDIGATGVLFFSKNMHAVGEMLELNFILPVVPFREMLLPGKAVRCNTLSDGETVVGSEVGFRFMGINEVDREHVIRYVVKRQMQLRREKQG
jgi:hypothetical protein